MAGFTQKFEVQKGRTITCLQGVVHEGGILSLASFSGNDEKAKKKLIVALVAIGSLKPVPLTEVEKEALAEAEAKAKKEDKARAKKQAEAAAEKEASEKAGAGSKAKADKEVTILSADFDSMKKDQMIQFAEEWGIELQETKVDDIKAELNLLKESLKSL